MFISHRVRFPFPVAAKRDEGFSGPIRLVGVRPDVRGTVKPLSGTIAADSTTGTLPCRRRRLGAAWRSVALSMPSMISQQSGFASRCNR